MLEVKGVSALSNESITTDGYIPIRVSWGDITPTVYWRTGDIETSLFELSIDEKTHTVKGLSVTLPGRVVESSETYIPKDVSAKSGLPICRIDEKQINDWNCINQPASFEMHIHKTGVSLLLSSNTEIVSTINAGKVSFGLDKNQKLSLITIGNLSESEMSSLVSSLN